MIVSLQIGRVETEAGCGDGFVGWRKLKISLGDVAAKARVDMRDKAADSTRKS
jgi:hypothetical protein